METAVVQLYAVLPRAITNTWTSVSACDPCSARRGRGEMTGDITPTYHDRIQVTNRSQLAAIVQELEAWQQVHFQRFESSCTITKNFSDPAASNSTCVGQLETDTQWYQGTHCHRSRRRCHTSGPARKSDMHKISHPFFESLRG